VQPAGLLLSFQPSPFGDVDTTVFCRSQKSYQQIYHCLHSMIEHAKNKNLESYFGLH